MSTVEKTSQTQKTKEQLSNELAKAHARIAEMEVSEAEHERRVAELSIVNQIGQTASFALELDELLAMVHQQVSCLFETEDFYIARRV